MTASTYCADCDCDKDEMEIYDMKRCVVVYDVFCGMVSIFFVWNSDDQSFSPSMMVSSNSLRSRDRSPELFVVVSELSENTNDAKPCEDVKRCCCCC